MKRFGYFIAALALLFGSNLVFGVSGGQKTIEISREMTLAATEALQRVEMWVPAEPLDFESQLTFELSIAKKPLTSERETAYFTLEDPATPGKTVIRRVFTASGNLTVPKGVRYKAVLFAGEYSTLFARSGADVNLKLKYTELLIRYAQSDQPYTFRLEAGGPAGMTDWRWYWTGLQPTAGNPVTVQFNRTGILPVVVEGKSRTSSRKFLFDLEVPSLLSVKPAIEPLKGPMELKVSTQANATVNYDQRTEFSWDFGDGSPAAAGTEATHTYTKPGKYRLMLTSRAGDRISQQSWVVEVTPLQVFPNTVVAPASGPVPLEVAGSVNPQVAGGPTDLKFAWDVAGKIVEGKSFKERFTEPGDYRVVLRTVDKLHPDLAIAEEVFLIQAFPPRIDLTPKASLSSGVIPLTVTFDPGIEIKGSPQEILVRWEFGDGESSEQLKPTHVYKEPGEYQVNLTVADRLHPGNLAAASVKVTATPPQLTANAVASAKEGLIPLAVNFSGQAGVTGSPFEPLYIWDFGDGETSFEQHPSHVYHRVGKFTVRLEIRDRLHPGNKAQTSLEVETKLPKLRVTASVLPTSGGAPLIVQGRAWAEKEGSSGSNLKYRWDFGDGTRAEGTEPKHTFERPGTYTVTLTVEDPLLGLNEKKMFRISVK